MKLKEDGVGAPTNSAGAGGVAGIGVGPQGEPPVSVKTQRKIQKRQKSTPTSVVLGYLRRKAPNQLAEETEKQGHALVVNNKVVARGSKRQMVSHAKKHHGGLSHQKGIHLTITGKKVGQNWKDVIKEETFGGAAVFEVSSHTFHNAKMEKRKGKHWRIYLEEDDCLAEIREYANKNPGRAIVLRNQNTGEMTVARHGKGKTGRFLYK